MRRLSETFALDFRGGCLTETGCGFGSRIFTKDQLVVADDYQLPSFRSVKVRKVCL
jgi:hypothetical protein